MISLDYSCFINSSGYSIAAQNYIQALYNSQKYDIRLNLFGSRPSRPGVSDSKYEFFMGMCRKPINSNSLQVYHCIPTLQKRVKKLKKNIGFAVFETFDPPSEWIKILNENDAIIVPSEFNYKVFGHSKIDKPIFYIPHCIDIDVYHENVQPMKKFDKFTFLFIGTWKRRKGYQSLIEAWCSEFTQEDNVQLVIKTDKVKIAEEYVSRYKQKLNKKGLADILFEYKVFEEEKIPSFLKSFDALIAPSMGEGFYIPGLQCMALKIPVIITDFSGSQDYATSETATLIKPEGFVQLEDMDGIPQFRRKKWAFITTESIKQSMRYVLNNKIDIEQKILAGYEKVRKEFNYQNISEKFTNMVKQVYGS